jgi:hypothetical protein
MREWAYAFWLDNLAAATALVASLIGAIQTVREILPWKCPASPLPTAPGITALMKWRLFPRYKSMVRAISLSSLPLSPATGFWTVADSPTSWPGFTARPFRRALRFSPHQTSKPQPSTQG